MRLIDAEQLKEHIICIAEQRGKKAATLCKLIDMQPEVSEREQVLHEVTNMLKTEGWHAWQGSIGSCNSSCEGDCSLCKKYFCEVVDELLYQLKNE